MSKTKLFAASLAVLGFAAFGSTQARADAVAVADINITAAFLSGSEAVLAGLSVSQVNNTQGVTVGFGPIGDEQTLTESLTTNPVYDGSVLSLGSPTNGATGQASLSGTLNGGSVASNTLSTATLLNGYVSSADQSKTGTTTTFTFTPSTSGSISLVLIGSTEAYANVSNSTNSTQTADASTSFVVKLTGNGSTQSWTPNDGAGDDFLDQSVGVIGTNSTQGSSTPTTFNGTTNSDYVGIFNLVAGQNYTFQITQQVAADGFAIPEPGTLALFGTGLMGLGFLMSARRRNSNAA